MFKLHCLLGAKQQSRKNTPIPSGPIARLPRRTAGRLLLRPRQQHAGRPFPRSLSENSLWLAHILNSLFLHWTQALLRHSSCSPGCPCVFSSLLRLQICFLLPPSPPPFLYSSPLFLSPVVSSDGKGERAQLLAAGLSERNAQRLRKQD